MYLCIWKRKEANKVISGRLTLTHSHKKKAKVKEKGTVKHNIKIKQSKIEREGTATQARKR